jgi:membrane-associated protease RseP (regulator of RpoE activity)
MRRFVTALLTIALALGGGLTFLRAGGAPVAQAPRVPATFGARLKPLPPLLYEHLPQLKKGQGLAVEYVLPKSFAERTGLRVHDILLHYDGTDLTSSEQLHQLLRGSNPDSPGALTLLRQGKEMKLDVLMAPGQTVTGSIKRGGPPAINLTATPQTNGKLKVTFEYYADEDSGKLRQLTCTGSLQEIEQQVQQLPERVQDVARVAVQRLRTVSRP